MGDAREHLRHSTVARRVIVASQTEELVFVNQWTTGVSLANGTEHSILKTHCAIDTHGMVKVRLQVHRIAKYSASENVLLQNVDIMLQDSSVCTVHCSANVEKVPRHHRSSPYTEDYEI